MSLQSKDAAVRKDFEAAVMNSTLVVSRYGRRRLPCLSFRSSCVATTMCLSDPRTVLFRHAFSKLLRADTILLAEHTRTPVFLAAGYNG